MEVTSLTLTSSSYVMGFVFDSYLGVCLKTPVRLVWDVSSMSESLGKCPIGIPGFWESLPCHYHVLVHQISFCILKSRSFPSGCESYGGILANEMSINGQNVMSDDLRGTEALKHGALRVFPIRKM